MRTKAKTALDNDNVFQETKDKIANFELWGKIAKISLSLLVFLIPLFFLPWTINVLDFNKQALLVVLVFVTLFSWILKVLVSGKLEINLSRSHLPVIALLLFYGVSTAFSAWRYGSFWGWPLNVTAGFLTLLFCFFAYFLIINIFGEKRKLFSLLSLLVFSSALAAFYAIFQLYGKFLLPWAFTKSSAFNTIGTPNTLAVFLAILLPLSIILTLGAEKRKKMLLAAASIVMLLTLLFINFKTAWIVLIMGSALLFIFGMLNLKSGQVKWIQLPVALLVIALFFLTFRISLPGFPQAPAEVSLTQRAELGIAKNNLNQIIPLILGTGPGTFVYDYSKFKPQVLNNTVFWNARLNVGASEVLDRFLTAGLLGLLILLFVFAMFFRQGFQYLKEKAGTAGENKNWLLGLGIFASFGASVVAQFLYPFNFSLSFLFWILLAGLIIFNKENVKEWIIQPSSSLSVAISSLLVIILIFGIGLFFLGAPKYMAEIKYFQGITAWQKSQIESDAQKRETLLGDSFSRLLDAKNLNPTMDIYWRDISQLSLIRLNELSRKQNVPQEQLTAQAQGLVNDAINAGKITTDLNPKNVANWNMRGFVYQNLIGIAGGSADWAVGAYKAAIELEPNNPYIYTEIGKVYLAKSDLKEGEQTENFKLASQNFDQALKLKSDYAPAHFQIAMISVREGKMNEAIDKLEKTKEVAPFDTGLAFQLGLIYYQNNQFDKAKGELERAVKLDNNYSNARYFLGLVYDKQGNKSGAMEQFEIISKSNPDNQEVKKILSNLQNGKAALEGILANQPPIEEKPEEIKTEIKKEGTKKETKE